jgi:hypothetical protein
MGVFDCSHNAAYDIFQLQVVLYAGVRRFARDLLKAGEGQFKLLNRFWISPLKVWGFLKSIPATVLFTR